MMKIFKNKTVKIIVIAALVLLLLPFVAFGILYVFVLPPQKLTPIVVNLVNNNLNATFACNEVQLTFFSTYPNFGIRVDSGRLLSSVAHDTVPDTYDYKGKDTLLTFSKCEAMLKVLDYLRKGEITIGNLIVEDANIYGFVNAAGKANWEIIVPTDSLAVDTTSTPLPPINVNHLQIKNANLSYYDRVQRLYTGVRGFSLNVKGDLVEGTNFLDIKAGWDRFNIYSPSYTMQNSLAFQLNTKLEVSDNYNRFKVSGAKLKVNEMPFLIDGEVFNNAETKCLDVDVAYELTVPDMESLLNFVPVKYIDGHKLTTTGEIHLAGTVKGVLGEKDYPVVKSICTIKNGSVRSDKVKYGIEKIELDVDVSLDIADNKNSYINLKKVFVKSEHVNLDVVAKTTNLLTNPQFNGKIKSDINFTELSKNIFTSDTLQMQGRLLADVAARFSLNDILSGNYGRIQATGEMDISDFKALSVPYALNVSVTKAKMTMTSERTIEKVADGKRLLNAKLYVDSLNMVYGGNVNSNVKNLYVSLSTPVMPDTTAIVPVTGRVSFDQARVQLPDSVWVLIGKSEIKGGLLPSSTDKKSPVLVAIMDSDSLAYLMPEVQTGVFFTKSSFNARIVPYVAKARQRTIRDSTLRTRQNIERDSTLILTGTSSEMLSKFEVSGKLGFAKMRMWSPFFPVRMEMVGTSLQFTSNDVLLSDAKLSLGKSDFMISGKISNIRRALLRGGKLSAQLTTMSDYINYEELIDAIARGVSYSENQDKGAKTFDIQSLDDVQQLSRVTSENADTVTGLFVLPAYLNLELNTKAKKIDYKHMSLLDTHGELVLRNQSAQLTNFYLTSNIGQGGISMYYTARNKTEATLGIDIDMKGIMVEKFIDLAPSVDTLLPMLKSFEGVLDCQLVATCMLDSTSSVILPSLQSACYLRGKDLVLLDGEAFTEISKKLMFKNKKRNVIDSIAVDVTVNENNVEIYPFLVEMDRYRLAVGGTHNFDMSFNYHISVLRSPVPFKLGVDVMGTIDNFDYKITKCRYKEMFKSAKTGTIDTTRLNVRREIYMGIQKLIRSNLNENYKARQFSQMVESMLPADSLTQSLAEQPPIRREDVEEEDELTN